MSLNYKDIIYLVILAILEILAILAVLEIVAILAILESLSINLRDTYFPPIPPPP